MAEPEAPQSPAFFPRPLTPAQTQKETVSAVMKDDTERLQKTQIEPESPAVSMKKKVDEDGAGAAANASAMNDTQKSVQDNLQNDK